MLILPGIAGPVGGQYNRLGLLDRLSASATACALGYTPDVLDISGENYAGNPQARAAIRMIEADSSIIGIYGYSGGGYNAVHIWAALNASERARMKDLMIIGAPGVTLRSFPGFTGTFHDYPFVRGVDHLDLPQAIAERHEEIVGRPPEDTADV